MNKAIIMHTFLRLARPGTLLTLVMFVLVYPTAIITFMSRVPGVSFDFEALLSLFVGPMMINLIAFAFISSSVGNTKSLDDGEYLAVLFSRPLFRWQYIVSKWLAGSALIIVVITLQILVFMTLLFFIGRGSAISMGLIDVANLVLNAFEASALVVMIFSFPSRIGAMIFAVLIYLSFAAPIMINAVPSDAAWLTSNTKESINFFSGFLRGLVYSPIDLDPYFNSIQILWLPVWTFISNMILYLWIAIIVMNSREFFYTD
jgi:hypothetical protein